MSAEQKLKQMSKEAPDKSAATGVNISAIDDVITELSEQRDAVTDGICGVAETEAIAYITTVILPIWLLVQPTAYIAYGAGFGTIAWSDPGPIGNISAWGIYYDVTPVPPPTLLYSYTPTDYPDLDTMVTDYSFGNDQLTRPLTDGATYGISPNITALSGGKAILQENQDKLDGIPDVYSRYTS